MRAPVAPSGWPSAMAPPLTFTRSQSQFSAWPFARILRRERLVDFNQVVVVDTGARPLQQPPDRV